MFTLVNAAGHALTESEARALPKDKRTEIEQTSRNCVLRLPATWKRPARWSAL